MYKNYIEFENDMKEAGLTEEQIKEIYKREATARKNQEKSAKEFSEYMMQQLPEKKIEAFWNAEYRNFYLTSEMFLRDASFTVYKEGWYLEFNGCRSRFAVWAFDRDGCLEFGRKPKESKLNKLWFSGFDNTFITSTCEDGKYSIVIDNIRKKW